MTLPENERELLDRALLAFNQQTELVLAVQELSEPFSTTVDTVLKLHPYDITYNTVLKRWVQQANLGSIAAQLSRIPAPALLVVDYVNPNMADRLRSAGVQFVDAAGNAYIRDKNLFIFVKGNRASSEYPSPRRTIRAFNASGLKVIFSFLLDPNLVGETYRTIAKVSGVSLGTIGWVLSDLKDLGYVDERGKRKARYLVKPLGLLDRWAEAYPEKLVPDLDMGLFQTPFPLPWKEIDLSQVEGCWGGEVGASLLDDVLLPAQGTVYLPKNNLKALLMKYRIRKANTNLPMSSDIIRICDKFWTRSAEPVGLGSRPNKAAPDILVYADLLASGDPRNYEAAERLYDRIKARFGID